MRGQLSAEMLIMVTVVLAIVAIAASQLLSGASGAADQIETQSDSLYNTTSTAMSCGKPCTVDDECGEPCPVCSHGYCS